MNKYEKEWLAEFNLATKTGRFKNDKIKFTEVHKDEIEEERRAYRRDMMNNLDQMVINKNRVNAHELIVDQKLAPRKKPNESKRDERGRFKSKPRSK